jgi:hypothetical protein
MRVPDTARNRLARSHPAAAAAILVVTGLFASLCCVGRNSFWPPNPHLNREFLEKM